MMDSLITCPLCSQPRFPDVDSLWLTLIRASTRQLACPVCQEVLVGLDKLTIHLVSHSLHGHLVRACLASNLASTPLTLAKVGAFGSSQVAPSLEPNNQTPTSGDHKGNAPIASYILLNFPTLGISQSERYCEIAGPSCETDIGNENGDKQATCALSQELDFTSLLQTNSDKNNSITNKTASALPLNVGATNVNSPVKLNVPIEPLFTEQDISVEMSFSNASKDVPADKLCASKCMILSNQMSTSCGTQQSRMDNDLPVGHIGCPTFNNYVGCPISEKLGIARGFDDGSPSTIEDSSVSCGVCSLTFRDTNIAMLHQKLVHSQNHLINSQTEMIPHNESDDRNLSSKRWRGSSLKHVAGSPHRYPCHICNKVFRMRGSLMVHLRVAHSPSGLNLLQQLDSSSSKSQPSKQALIKNEGDVFCTSSDIDCSSVCTDNKTNEETPVSSLSPSLSPTCSPMTQAGSDESVCMVFPCNLCNKTYAKEALLTQHLKSHDSKQWECDVCFKSFTTKYFLKKHKRLHTGEMPYTCGICNKSFTFQQSYHKHLLYHSDEKPHSCTECGRAFKELSTLHNHQRIHTGEKPWACETCGKCFRQRVSYLVHRRIHTGAMPYQCTVCLKSFRYKVSQRTHKCITQATGDTSTQSGDLLQQLLQFPQKEVDSRSAGFSGEPHILLKEQLQHLNIKQENPQLMNVSKIAHPSREIHSNHFSNRDQGGFQSEPNLCNVEENLPSLAQPQTAESLVTSSGYSRFMGDLSQNEKQPSDFGSFPPCKTDVISNAPSSNSCEADPTAENSLLPTLEHHGNAETAIVHVPVSQPSLSSSVDFSTDLFQDILSMVMSPSSENVPSPSAQMRLLSISGAQNDNDLDSGLDLQQLLYGSCDSGNTP